jgi:hypothetical protein
MPATPVFELPASNVYRLSTPRLDGVEPLIELPPSALMDQTTP